MEERTFGGGGSGLFGGTKETCSREESSAFGGIVANKNSHGEKRNQFVTGTDCGPPGGVD